MNKKTIEISVLVVALVVGWYITSHTTKKTPNNSNQTLIESVSYQCDASKSIQADYLKGSDASTITPGQPPAPSGSVSVKLSDGRSMTLVQSISADGTRYSNGDPAVSGSETFVFWSKGNEAVVLENNQQKTYTGCVRVAENTGDTTQIYESSPMGFSIRYPDGYVPKTYSYDALGPGRKISGVKFIINPKLTAGTNLATDSYVSVEEIPNVAVCSATAFLDGATIQEEKITENGVEYSFASTTGAGAGNRYEESVYVILGSNPCVAVRYSLHYGVIENYPEGSTKVFDKSALLSQFDSMRKTLVISK